MLRIKRLEYNQSGALEEIDMGPLPPGLEEIAREGRSFSYTVGGVTYTRCYVESENESHSSLGYAIVLAVTVVSGFALRLLLDFFMAR